MENVRAFYNWMTYGIPTLVVLWLVAVVLLIRRGGWKKPLAAFLAGPLVIAGFYAALINRYLIGVWGAPKGP